MAAGAKESSEMKFLLTNDLFVALLSLANPNENIFKLCNIAHRENANKSKRKSPNDFVKYRRIA